MKTLKTLWREIFSHSKLLVFLLFISSSVYALMVIPVWAQKSFIENVELYVNQAVSFNTVIISLLILYGTRVLIGGFLVPFGASKDLYYEYKVTKNVSLSQHQINNKMNLEYYESSNIYNLLLRAKTSLTNGALRQTVDTIGSILTLVLSLFTIIGSLYLFHPIFSIIAVISVIPLFFEQWVFAKKVLHMRKVIIEKRRYQEHCIKHIIGKEYCLETRISNSSHYFKHKWQHYQKEIEKQEIDLEKYKLTYNLIFNLFKTICILLIIVIAALFLMEDKITIGIFSGILGIVGFIHASTGYFISRVSSLGTEWQELIEVSQYYDLNTQSENRETVNQCEHITIENVSFQYPNQQKAAVSNVSFHVKKGEKIALLGVNGSGKTTLVNLLLGLYTPNEGSIYYNGIDIKTLNKHRLHKQMSAVFQDFNVYEVSIRENVIFGNMEETNIESEIYQSLKKAGFNINKYSNIETMIGKSFNGIELSRGESQQLAIARSYYNQSAEIFVIDEPTAALDPIAEEKLYKQFLYHTGNKTTFIISHRLGSVNIADRIIVMDNGKIIEDGTHEELMNQNGLYREMYHKQLALYNR